jgi:beta-N-acetylhexosaminidase
MSLGPVMVDLKGTTLTPEEREMLLHPLVGAVIYFTRNFESPEQIAALTREIHALRNPPLLVCVDHEGGRVQRFRTGFTRLPPVRRLGRVYDRDPKHARHLAETFGWVMASELRAVGVDFSFAPVLDVDRNVSRVIGDRAFHGSAEAVADLAHAYMRGMHLAGMAATGKHFPGHGSCEADSHVDVPVDPRRYEDILVDDLVPFERMIHFGMEAIMPAHVIYSAVDPQPAGFSNFWIRDVLRARLGFQGVIFSDDLSMEGARVAGGYVERARAAFQAGCDMALVCNNPQAAAQVLDGLAGYHDPAAAARLIRMHGRGATTRDALLQDARWHHAVQQLNELAEDSTLDLGL